MSKPFRISTQWLWYAHGPGCDSGQPLASGICRYATDAGDKTTATIPPDRARLVQEIVSVAELYTNSRGDDAEDKARARRATVIIKRAKAWLAITASTGSNT